MERACDREIPGSGGLGTLPLYNDTLLMPRDRPRSAAEELVRAAPEPLK